MKLRIEAAALAAVVGIAFVVGVGLHIAMVEINRTWPPVSQQQQRAAAIQASMRNLAEIGRPDLYAALESQTAIKILTRELSERVRAVEIENVEELKIVDLGVAFDRQAVVVEFGFEIVLENPAIRLTGSVFGGAVVASDSMSVAFRPYAETLRLSRIEVAKLSALFTSKSIVVGAANLVLRRFIDNINGQIAGPFIADIKLRPIPPLHPDRILRKNPDIEVISSKPIVFDARPRRQAILLDSNRLQVLGALTAPSASATSAGASVSFEELVSAFDDKRRAAGFDPLGPDQRARASVTKPAVARILNTALMDPDLAFKVRIPRSRSKDFDEEIGFKVSTSINCDNVKKPWQHYSCKRDCGELDFACKLKAEACRNKRKAKRLKHDLENSFRVGKCKVRKEAIRALGDFARIGRARGHAEFEGWAGIRAERFTFSDELDSVRLTSLLAADLKVDTLLHFTPKGGGYILACGASWTRRFSSDVVGGPTRTPIDGVLKVERNQSDGLTIAVETREFYVPAQIDPPPIVSLFSNPAQIILCPIIFTLSVRVLVADELYRILKDRSALPERLRTVFRGEYRYKQKPRNFSFDIEPIEIEFGGEVIDLRPEWNASTLGFVSLRSSQ